MRLHQWRPGLEMKTRKWDNVMGPFKTSAKRPVKRLLIPAIMAQLTPPSAWCYRGGFPLTYKTIKRSGPAGCNCLSGGHWLLGEGCQAGLFTRTAAREYNWQSSRILQYSGILTLHWGRFLNTWPALIVRSTPAGGTFQSPADSFICIWFFCAWAWMNA